MDHAVNEEAPLNRHERRAAPHAQRRGMTIADFCRVYGIGRSTAFELIRDGEIEARKAGQRTLIVVESADRWFDALPRRGSAA